MATYEEKETDVSIAIALLEDGVNKRFDTALVISADSDLRPPVRALRRLRPSARVIAAFPPMRRSDALRSTCQGTLHIGEAALRGAQLPEIVMAGDGRRHKRPTHWA